MGRISVSMYVGTLVKVAATVAVALVAFGATANPARADAAFSIDITADPDPAEVGQVLTYTIVVKNTGDEVAQNVAFATNVNNPSGTYSTQVSFVSTTKGFCLDQDVISVGCQFGDLAPGEEVTVVVQTVPPTAETLITQAFAVADNVPDTGASIQTEVEEDLGGPGGGNGERVLVEHNGKELCLPKAALHGHKKHGDEVVIDEEGCSNAGA